MSRILKLAVVSLLLSSANAMATACDDPTWTKAIKEAMGRPPKAGECDLRLYGQASSHSERVRAVRNTLTQIYRDCYGTVEGDAQKLPLRSCAKADAPKAKSIGKVRPVAPVAPAISDGDYALERDGCCYEHSGVYLTP